MDLKGTLVDTNLRIYLNEKSLEFLKTIPVTQKLPNNIIQIIKNDSSYEPKQKTPINNDIRSVQINNKDLENLDKIKKALNTIDTEKEPSHDEVILKETENENLTDTEKEKTCDEIILKETETDNKQENNEDTDEQYGEYYLTTTDLDWLYNYIKSKHDSGDKTVPYLHVLLEGSHIEMPKNEVIKRNPVLEARCVKLRAQQEAREYRKMTKGVDNVRMRFPEDSISYQLKQVNRQLIAIGQFIISIFAGFLFGFRGVEWMVGNLDFGFRLLLGVMCALVIALAEIYFLAKKLNEELNIPETIQLGGPPKLANENKTKQHLD